MRWVVLLLLTACDDSTGTTDGNPPTVVGYADADLDGFISSVDCDDENPAVNPGQPEVCNTIDDDCDGGIDNNAVDGSVGFVDADGDMVGSDVPLVSCTVPGWSPDSGDCDDADAARFPGNTEACNGIDDDCDLGVDEGASIGNVRYETLADAVLAAGDGNVVVLCDGTTQAGAVVIDSAVTITSVSGDPALTVIDGSGVGSSVFIVDGGDLTLDGVTVKGGSGTFATLVVGQAQVLAGGAINALVGDGGPVTVRNCVLSWNGARGGGAIAAGILTIEDSTLVGNAVIGASPGEGGAVWIAAEGAFTATRTVFEANSATGGGALSIHAPTTLIDIEAFGNTVYGNGGFAIVQSVEGATRATVTIEGGDIHDHVGAYNGGAIWLVDADGTADATTAFTANTGVEGGALALTSEIVGGAVVSWSGGTFTDNVAESVGGAIITQAGTASAEISDVVVTDNVADNQGGGITLQGNATSSTTVRDSVISDNQSFGGGGVSILNSFELPPMVFERVEITDNVALSTGGAILLFFSQVEILDSVISNNTASESGGGIWLDARPIINITSSDFAGNLPEDVWFVQTGMGTDLPDVDATLVCTGADGTCL